MNTIVVFSLYLLFAFLNRNSVMRMVIQYDLSTNVFLYYFIHKSSTPRELVALYIS
jgi:hypothetical protein